MRRCLSEWSIGSGAGQRVRGPSLHWVVKFEVYKVYKLCMLKLIYRIALDMVHRKTVNLKNLGRSENE